MNKKYYTSGIQVFIYFQRNVMIVDTPGFGYLEHNDVAEKMKPYLQKAVAFVVVVNAGGPKDGMVFCTRHHFINSFYSFLV